MILCGNFKSFSLLRWAGEEALILVFTITRKKIPTNSFINLALSSSLYLIRQLFLVNLKEKLQSM